MELHFKNRLKIYESALKHYQRADKWYGVFLSARDTTRKGFCFYFTEVYHDILNDELFKKALPELYSQRPNMQKASYWFEPGDLKPRIKCLEEAIKLYNASNG
jgi:hypothetical protein